MNEKAMSECRVTNASIDAVELMDGPGLYGELNETEKVYSLLQAASIISTRIDCGSETWKQFIARACAEAVTSISAINDPDKYQ